MKKHWKKILLAAVIVAAILFLGLLKFSTSPAFCHSCHIMKPYYDSWANSKHNKTSCVMCHYPPTKKADLLWRKFQALSQVVKYVTRTYSSKPFAEVDDSACLRKGCHSTRLLEGKVEFGQGIKFDHTPHLSETRRGRKLRCASCHSQIVVGRHVEVTLDTCYLCHFKGMKTGREISALGGCTSCHMPPETDFKIGNITYNHKEFTAKHGVECINCHLDVIEGEGEAPKDRCFTCHNQPEKLARYEDIPFIHENHITKHHVACFHCHKEIKHSVKTATGMVSLDCNMCHINKHTTERDIYQGTGAREVADMPSPMFLAQVDCVACHIVPEEEKTQEKFTGQTYKATEQGCLKCHDEKYLGLVAAWKAELDGALETIETRIDEALKIMPLILVDEPNYRYAQRLLDDISYNFNFIRLSAGIHNIYYSAQILQSVNENLDRFIAAVPTTSKTVGKTLPPAKENSLLNGAFCATLCHTKLAVTLAEEVEYEGRTIPHTQHTEFGLSCNACHIIGAHKDLKLKENLEPSKDPRCTSCH